MDFDDGLTFGPDFGSDPLDDLSRSPLDDFRSPVDDMVRRSSPLYPLSNEYKRDQQRLAEQQAYLDRQAEITRSYTPSTSIPLSSYLINPVLPVTPPPRPQTPPPKPPASTVTIPAIPPPSVLSSARPTTPTYTPPSASRESPLQVVLGTVAGLIGLCIFGAFWTAITSPHNPEPGTTSYTYTASSSGNEASGGTDGSTSSRASGGATTSSNTSLVAPDTSASADSCSCDTDPREDIPVTEMHVASRGLNLRSGPGTDYDVIEQLSEGATVYMFSDNVEVDGGVWVKIDVDADGEVGWVNKRFLR